MSEVITLKRNSLSKSKEIIKNEINKLEKPDGGYGWVILFSALTISFILDGCMYSFGILLDEIKTHYGVKQDITNLVSSLNTGFLFLSG